MEVAKQESRSRYPNGFYKETLRGKHDLVLNERLRSARIRKGLSSAGVIKALAKKGISIGHSTIRGYEADENSLNHRYPSLPVLIDLANFYEVSTDYLLGKTELPTPRSNSLDIADLLASKKSVMYNGEKLSKKQRDELGVFLDTLLTN